MNSFDKFESRLKEHGQGHLLRFVGEMSEDEKGVLLQQLEEIDFDYLDQLIKEYVIHDHEFNIPDNLSAPVIVPADGGDMKEIAVERGRQLISEGKVAAFVVAGGQGTRLGYDGPKGCFPATPIKQKPLFRVFAEQIRAASERFGATIPWYILTSPINDDPTRAHFVQNNFWGLDPENVVFIIQGTMPAIDYEGKLMLAEKYRLATSPDGHGGSLTALCRSGALDDMKARGVQQISYFQVDNPIVRCIDPLFIGLHDLAEAGMSAKALSKRDPFEKLGNFCGSGDRTYVIEYSDLSDELATARNADGTLLFSAGSIAIHVLRRTFVEELTEGGVCKLPLHRADKKVSYIDRTGQLVTPNEPNAVKLEMFIFDALPMSENSVILQTTREEEFSPIKNREGQDSPESCTADQIERYARWLADAGIDVPKDDEGKPDAVIEISPLYADSSEVLAEKIDRGLTISPGAELYIE